MNFVEALRTWSAHLENYFGGRTEFWEAQGVIAATVKMYDALAPDWSRAPDDARWYVIDPNGARYWFDDEPEANEWRWTNSDWFHDMGYEIVCTFPLPLGIDWRLCKWERP